MGCVTYQMIMLRPPFEASTLKSLAYQIIFKPPAKLNESYSFELRSLVMRMLEKNPLKRLSIEEVSLLIKEHYD